MGDPRKSLWRGIGVYELRGLAEGRGYESSAWETGRGGWRYPGVAIKIINAFMLTIADYSGIIKI